MNTRGLEDRIDQLVREARPGGVVDRDVLAFRVDKLERAGDGVGALGPAVDHLDVHERHAGAVAALEHLAILGGDRHDDLADVVAVDERLDRPQPDGSPIELGIDLLLLRVAKPRRLARGRQNDGELSLAHDTRSFPRHCPALAPILIVAARGVN